MNLDYPRNIRQFRDVINGTLDNACPLISDVTKPLDFSKHTIYVDVVHIPSSVINNAYSTKEITNKGKDEQMLNSTANEIIKKNSIPEKLIYELQDKGLGARKIAKLLNEEGYSDIKYYQISYLFKKREKM